LEVSYQNILTRDFSTTQPNEKWLTDVTEFKISNDTRKLYLRPILDLYDNSIIEHKLSFRNSNHFVFKIFDKAVKINLMLNQYSIVIGATNTQVTYLKIKSNLLK
jgi:transposase InsO family protein